MYFTNAVLISLALFINKNSFAHTRHQNEVGKCLSDKEVCGTDGKTYRNLCVLQKVQGVMLSHFGNCTSAKKKTPYRPDLILKSKIVNTTEESLQKKLVKHFNPVTGKWEYVVEILPTIVITPTFYHLQMANDIQAPSTHNITNTRTNAGLETVGTVSAPTELHVNNTIPTYLGKTPGGIFSKRRLIVNNSQGPFNTNEDIISEIVRNVTTNFPSSQAENRIVSIKNKTIPSFNPSMSHPNQSYPNVFPSRVISKLTGKKSLVHRLQTVVNKPKSLDLKFITSKLSAREKLLPFNRTNQTNLQKPLPQNPEYWKSRPKPVRVVPVVPPLYTSKIHELKPLFNENPLKTHELEPPFKHALRKNDSTGNYSNEVQPEKAVINNITDFLKNESLDAPNTELPKTLHGNATKTPNETAGYNSFQDLNYKLKNYRTPINTNLRPPYVKTFHRNQPFLWVPKVVFHLRTEVHNVKQKENNKFKPQYENVSSYTTTMDNATHNNSQSVIYPKLAKITEGYQKPIRNFSQPINLTAIKPSKEGNHGIVNITLPPRVPEEIQKDLPNNGPGLTNNITHLQRPIGPDFNVSVPRHDRIPPVIIENPKINITPIKSNSGSNTESIIKDSPNNGPGLANNITHLQRPIGPDFNVSVPRHDRVPPVIIENPKINITPIKSNSGTNTESIIKDLPNNGPAITNNSTHLQHPIGPDFAESAPDWVPPFPIENPMININQIKPNLETNTESIIKYLPNNGPDLTNNITNLQRPIGPDFNMSVPRHDRVPPVINENPKINITLIKSNSGANTESIIKDLPNNGPGITKNITHLQRPIGPDFNVSDPRHDRIPPVINENPKVNITPIKSNSGANTESIIKDLPNNGPGITNNRSLLDRIPNNGPRITKYRTHLQHPIGPNFTDLGTAHDRVPPVIIENPKKNINQYKPNTDSKTKSNTKWGTYYIKLPGNVSDYMDLVLNWEVLELKTNQPNLTINVSEVIGTTNYNWPQDSRLTTDTSVYNKFISGSLKPINEKIQRTVNKGVPHGADSKHPQYVNISKTGDVPISVKKTIVTKTYQLEDEMSLKENMKSGLLPGRKGWKKAAYISPSLQIKPKEFGHNLEKHGSYILELPSNIAGKFKLMFSWKLNNKLSKSIRTPIDVTEKEIKYDYKWELGDTNKDGKPIGNEKNQPFRNRTDQQKEIPSAIKYPFHRRTLIGRKNQGRSVHKLPHDLQNVHLDIPKTIPPLVKPSPSVKTEGIRSATNLYPGWYYMEMLFNVPGSGGSADSNSYTNQNNYNDKRKSQMDPTDLLTSNRSISSLLPNHHHSFLNKYAIEHAKAHQVKCDGETSSNQFNEGAH